MVQVVSNTLSRVSEICKTHGLEFVKKTKKIPSVTFAKYLELRTYYGEDKQWYVECRLKFEEAIVWKGISWEFGPICTDILEQVVSMLASWIQKLSNMVDYMNSLEGGGSSRNYKQVFEKVSKIFEEHGLVPVNVKEAKYPSISFASEHFRIRIEKQEKGFRLNCQPNSMFASVSFNFGPITSGELEELVPMMASWVQEFENIAKTFKPETIVLVG